MESRRRQTKNISTKPGDTSYRPHSNTQPTERSPYPTRPVGGRSAEEESVSESEEGVVGIESGEMAKRTEESEFMQWVRVMAERDEARRAEVERVEEARKEEMMAMFSQLKEESALRMSEGEETRRRYQEKKELQAEKLKALGNYTEKVELLGYLGKFERIMTDCGIRKDTWVERLFPRLPERLCARVESAREGDDYEEVKRVLLKAMGETTLTYGYRMFDLTGESLKAKTAGEIMEVIEKVSWGVIQGCESVKECAVAVATALTRNVIPPSGKVFLEGKKMERMEDLRDAWETWMAGRLRGNFYKPIGSSGGRSVSEFRRSSFGDDFSTKVRGGTGFITCFNCGERGHRSVECKKSSGNGSVGARPLTCFNCGKAGHRSVRCPNRKVGGVVKKVSKIVVGEKRKGNIAWGRVNGVDCRVLVDSGAEVGVVPRAFVGRGAVECGELHISGVNGMTSVHQSTVVEFEVGGLRLAKLVMIDERDAEEVMCIVPFDIASAEESAAFKVAIEEARDPGKMQGSQEVQVKVLTRSQARAEALSEVIDMDASYTDLWSVVEPEEAEGSVLEERDESAGTEGLDEEGECVASVSEEGTPSDLKDAMVVDGRERQLVEYAGQIGPVGKGSDGVDFRKELGEDESLKEWRELGERKERGFSWKKGILVKSQFVTWEEFRDVVVVPRSYRSKVMEIAHEKNGHLSGDKVVKMVGRYFVWPGMAKELCEHCRSCGVCQRKSKHTPRRALAVERPLLSEPFEAMAVDLVGPLPKGKGGNRFLLTCVCLATRWPEAVPLRSITARAVAEGLWSIFSRTSVPEKMLSDQGGQFCGKVVGELSKMLGIERVRTSPYHPQTNGTVERFHGTLKSILGKCVDEGKDWVEQLPFALFVLRQMPHADSGFSPFDLVYGFRVRTPLDALYSGLFEVESKELNVCEWVRGMAEKLELMRDCAELKMAKGKEGRMKYLNRGCKTREFVVGDLVLCRVPGMQCKLSDSWGGPYEVLERIGEVNYRICRKGMSKQARVVHVNCLKKFRERFAVNRLDVVLEDGSEEECLLRGMCDGYVQGEIDSLLGEFEDVFSDAPGSTDVVVLSIDTGDALPIRQAPYSVPLGIRKVVKEELDELERGGIIERSASVWASPLVPVKKAGGGIRLCVDYRKLNAITTKEPYYIPQFEEMVERVGQGCVLSKVDLSKGFHQVAVAVEDREKTAFVCPFGKFQYVRMPFGLTNAPSVFQRLMDVVLVDCMEFAKVYIDDVLVVSGGWSEHLMHLRRLFEVLLKAGLTCKLSKCVFGKRRLMFLGHEAGVTDIGAISHDIEESCNVTTVNQVTGITYPVAVVIGTVSCIFGIFIGIVGTCSGVFEK